MQKISLRDDLFSLVRFLKNRFNAFWRQQQQQKNGAIRLLKIKLLLALIAFFENKSNSTSGYILIS